MTDMTDSELLALVRTAATQYGRCCDLYQDGTGEFHCHEDGQRTFAMLRDVQQILGIDKALDETSESLRIIARNRALMNNAAHDMLMALQALVDRTIEYGDEPDAILECDVEMRALARAGQEAINKAMGVS